MDTQTTAIGTWIKEARIAAGSHDKLAAMIGSTRQHIIKLEKGQHKPRPEMIARIAEATGKPAPAAEDEEAGRAMPLDEELLLRAIATAIEHALDSSRRQRSAA